MIGAGAGAGGASHENELVSGDDVETALCGGLCLVISSTRFFVFACFIRIISKMLVAEI